MKIVLYCTFKKTKKTNRSEKVFFLINILIITIEKTIIEPIPIKENSLCGDISVIVVAIIPEVTMQ
ncbi:MAG: hypothetical protein RR790_07925 [Eubacterium sp.]